MSANSLRVTNAAANRFFIADLHLDPNKAEAYALALSFFKQVRTAKALYILGDLFEYWIGDDVGLELYQDVILELRNISDAGVELVVMLGNRDFLLGEDFARATGATLVHNDEHVINIDNERVLLVHGDTLCTDDTEYEELREHLRSPQWRSEFLALSKEQRTIAAKGLREQSKEYSAKKTHELMDVTEATVTARMNANQCNTLVHGHTHRPAVHSAEQSSTRRLVVGDWHDNHAHIVVYHENTLQLCEFNGALFTE